MTGDRPDNVHIKFF